MGNSSSSNAKETLPNKPVCIVVGGGYGGVEVASRLDNDCNVILIDKKNHFFNNMGALRPVVRPETTHIIAPPYDRVLTNGAFIQATVTNITDKQVTLLHSSNNQSYKLTFDYVVIATGSSYAFPMKHQLSHAKDLIAKYTECAKHVSDAKDIVIIGGGPVGIELLGEIAAVYNDKNITLIHNGDKILPGGMKDELRDSILERIKTSFGESCKVITGERVNIDEKMKEEMSGDNGVGGGNNSYLVGKRVVETNKGTKVDADIVFLAFGNKLNNDAFKDFFKDAINSETGRLKVNKRMQVEGYTNVFALGDCADGAPLMAANAAKNMGASPAVAHNIIQLVNGNNNNFKEWSAPPPWMFVPLGPNQGAGQLPMFGGKIVGARIVGMAKGQGLFCKEMWENLGYKQMSDKMVDQSGKQINSQLTSDDYKRLSSKVGMDQSLFEKLVNGELDGSENENKNSNENESKENESKQNENNNNENNNNETEDKNETETNGDSNNIVEEQANSSANNEAVKTDASPN